MSEGSRFASLAGRVRALAGLGETSSLAIVATEPGAGRQAGGEGGDGDEGGEADAAAAGAAEAEAQRQADAAAEAERASAAAAAQENGGSEAAAAATAARAEERQRMSTVFACEHIAGREQAAVMLLTETNMAADKIVAKLPTLAAAAAGNAMLANLAGTANPNLGAGAEAQGDTKSGAAVWDKVRGRA